MAFNDQINIIYGEGGLNTPLPGEDYISGMVFYSTTVPTGLSYSMSKQIYSVKDAENLGIVGDYSDETAAISNLTVTATGSAGALINIKVVEPDINNTYTTTQLCNYTVTSTDSTNSTLSTSLKNAINANFATTGYRAVTTGATLSITAKKGLGTIINGTTPTVTITGGSAITAAAFSGGVNSKRKEEHYQISEFFRLNPSGILWIQFVDSLATFDGIKKLQIDADFKLRQAGVYNMGATTSATITANIQAIQSVADFLTTNKAPLSVLYAPNLYSWSDLSTLDDLRLLGCRQVSGLAGSDGGAVGAHLAKMYGKSIPSLGATLGILSSSNVADDIGAVRDYNLSDGTELEIVAFSNGQLYSKVYNDSYNLLGQIDAKGWIFNMKRASQTGTWVNDSPTATSITSDYAWIERNRVVDKAARIVNTSLTPLINTKVATDPKTGFLLRTTISSFLNEINVNLREMVKNEELIGFETYIDPNQNVVSTGNLNVSVQLVPYGIARKITVTLGYSITV